MENFVQQGSRLTYLNGTSVDIDSGDVVLLTNRIGIAVVDIEADDSGEVQIEGVFELTKTTGQAWTVGQQLYWDATNSAVTTTAGANQAAGVAAEIVASATATGNVKINA